MIKKIYFPLLIALIVLLGLSACGNSPAAEPTQTTQMETITLNAHPTSLDGMTVVLRWNSKPNGDLYLNRLAELLTQQYKDITIIKLWETDPDTALISESVEDSAVIAEKIAALDPDMVIAAQGD
jgi:ABC-type Fe3+-hydroxamate transport system substrate-binding protein